MKYLLTLAILLIGSAVEVRAQQLEVRSGDHPAHTRLTIAIPDLQSWEAQQNNQRVTITLPGSVAGFNITDVFSRISRDRIGKIEASGNTLALHLNCQCLATTFREGSLLVVDITDQDTTPVGRQIDGRTVLSQIRPPTITRKNRPIRPALPWIGAKSPFAEMAEKSTTDRTLTNGHERTAGYHAPLLREVQQNLFAEVGNAASIGLLENTYIVPRPTEITSAQNAAPASIEAQVLPEIIASKSNNMRITNSMDRPNGSTNPTLDATSKGINCPDAAFVSVATWGSDIGFSAQIGPARNALVDARDHLDKSAARKLVELYIYFGFGAEALNVLGMDQQLSVSYPHLTDLATILEYGALGPNNSLGAFTECASDASLWASLSFDAIPRGTVIDTNAALRALNKLPIHLRQILAPALSDRLLQYGDVEAAATALRSIERLPDRPTPNAIMAEADLATKSGKPVDALLESVIQSNSAESPAALVKLVEGKLAKDEVLSASTATLVESYAQELRGTEMGNQLRRTQILALSQSGQFDEAFTALDAIAPSLSPKAGRQLRQVVLGGLVKRAPEITFLEHVFAHSKTEIEAFSSETKLAVAARLLELGFAAKSQDLVTSIPDRPLDHFRQLLEARAAIALDQPFKAQAALIGIHDPVAELLLAQAKEMTGSYNDAVQLFRNNNAEVQAVQAAWLSDDWRDLTASETSGLGPMTTLLQPNLSTPDLGVLELANQALAESSTARTTIEEMLRDPIVQVSPDF